MCKDLREENQNGKIDFAIFRTRLYNLAHSNPRKLNPRKLTQEVIKQSLDAVTNTLGVSLQIATVRERSGYREQRLRHVHASPEKIRSYFEKKDDGYDGITSHAFKDPSSKLNGPSDFAGLTETDNINYVLFDIKAKKVVLTNEAETKKGRYIFSNRIDNFLETISSKENYIEGISFNEINGCLIFGLTKSRSQKGTNNRSTSIGSMVALYVTYRGKTNDLKKKIRMCTHLVAEMFRTVEEIRIRERSDFERQALKEIVGLVPIFGDDNVSPSDAVAALLQTFKKIFKKHEYFGPGRYHEVPEKRKRQHQWVTFLSINYRKYDGDKGQIPLLSVFPKSEAKKNYVQSYRVSNPDTPSISKYLLYRDLKQSKEALPEAISTEFSDVDIPPKAFFPAGKSNYQRGLVLTSNDKDVWRKLHLDIVREGRTKTTAAFLLRRPSHEKTRPFAILAFESDYADAFSRADIELISRLVSASASLLSYIKLGNHSIDYSEQLKDAFAGITAYKIGGVRYSSIIYELLRFDHLAAKKILKSEDKLLWKSTSLKNNEVRECILKILRELDSNEIASDQVALYRWLRSQKTVELIEKEWGHNVHDIHNFLIAVPANNNWHCYLGSIARALADRDFGDSVQPTFKQFQPGYSALAMFVVTVANQTAQIAKLTTKKKLKLEQDNYSKYVRYKIPLAARIPANGIAFDTLGTEPRKKTSEDSPGIGYGVIVSDLIAGDHKLNPTPMSFLSLCADLMNRDFKERQLLATAIAEAIDHHFTENVRIWIVEGQQEWVKDSNKRRAGKVADFIEDLTGAGARSNSFATERNRVNIDQRLIDITDHHLGNPNLSEAIFQMLRDTCKYFDRYVKRSGEDGTEINFGPFNSLNELVETLVKRRPNRAEEDGEFIDMQIPHYFKPSYVHGDMNGNNLTWAANYNRFVMIDFENIQLGFVGADQLKLLASMICETVPTARGVRRGKTTFSAINGKAVDNGEHCDTISLVRLVSLLTSRVIGSEDKNRKIILQELYAKAKEVEAPLLEIAIAVIRTIRLEELELSTPNEQLFWRYTLRNLFYRQFEYAFRDIDTRHIKSLKAVSESIKKVVNDAEEPSDKKIDDFTFLNINSPNVLKSANNNNVITLFYSFLTLLGTL